MSAPSETIDAALFDGQSARRHTVGVEWLGDRVRIVGPGPDRDEVLAIELVRLDAPAGQAWFGHRRRPGWRLAMDRAAAAPLVALVAPPVNYGRAIDRIGLPAALALGVAATAALVGLFHVAPGWLATRVPTSWERKVGATMVGDLERWRCDDAPGQRALEAMAERLEPGVTRGPGAIRFHAVSPAVYNAAALPGNNVAIFRNMLAEAASPDALAGVVAHEIAHVRRRHVTEAIIRELGFGALVATVAGDIGTTAGQLASLSYTRHAEEEADADAIAMLRRAGIDPRDTATLFEELAKDMDDDREGAEFSRFFDSHPVSRARARRFATAADPTATYRPALSPAQAQSLEAACDSTPIPDLDPFS